MREVQFTDAELQALVAPALRKKLKAAGFQGGASDRSDWSPQGCIFLPVFIDMAGSVEIERTEDGVWTFRQELDFELSERTSAVQIIHTDVVVAQMKAEA